MLMKIHISILPSWVTGSRLSESLAREKTNVPPAAPAGAAVGWATLLGAGVAFWFTVTGLVGPAGLVGAAAGGAGAAPHAARSWPIAPVAPSPATRRKKRRRLNRVETSACSEYLSIVVASCCESYSEQSISAHGFTPHKRELLSPASP